MFDRDPEILARLMALENVRLIIARGGDTAAQVEEIRRVLELDALMDEVADGDDAGRADAEAA